MSILLPEDIVLILDSKILKDKYFEKKNIIILNNI